MRRIDRAVGTRRLGPALTRTLLAASLALATAAAVAVNAAAATAGPPARSQHAAARPIAPLLRPDGRLVTGQYNGAVDLNGYRMVTGPHGAPRFVRSARPAAAATGWTAGFGLPGAFSDPAQIHAVAVAGPKIYVGGSFSSFGDMRAASLNNVAEWTGTRWVPLGSGIGGTVDALLVSGGVVYAGGDFDTAGGVPAHSIAAFSAGHWSAMGGGVSVSSSDAFLAHEQVLALAAGNGLIYAGGQFDQAGPVAASGVAAWNPATSSWASLAGGMNTGASVNALAVDGSTLWATGGFDSAGGHAAEGVAAWNGASWTSAALVEQPNSQPAVGHALAVDVATDTVYVGLSYVTNTGVGGGYVAAYHAGTWSDVGDMAANPGNADVLSLSILSGRLYAGGDFSSAGGRVANDVAWFDGSAWHALGRGLDSSVFALAVAGTRLVAVGAFADTGATLLVGMGEWDGRTWLPFGNGTIETPWSGGRVDALAAMGNSIYAGGEFDQVGAAVVHSLARWTGSAWQSLAGGLRTVSNGSSTTGTVRALLVHKGVLYVAGRFNRAGTTVAQNIAAWDGSRWHALGSGVVGAAEALAVVGNKLFVGGTLSRAGATDVSELAAWNLTTHRWSALGNNPSFITTGYRDDITALAAVDNRFLLVGGAFTYLDKSVNGTATRSTDLDGLTVFDTHAAIARRNPFSGFGRPGGVTGAINCEESFVSSIDVLPSGDIYVGGCFDHAGVGHAGHPAGVAADGVALWKAGGDGSWHAAGRGTHGEVDALRYSNGLLYVGGSFDSAGPVATAGIAACRPLSRTWSGLGSGMAFIPTGDDVAPGPPDVDALVVSGKALFVGGAFNQAGGLPSSAFARWQTG